MSRTVTDSTLEGSSSFSIEQYTSPTIMSLVLLGITIAFAAIRKFPWHKRSLSPVSAATGELKASTPPGNRDRACGEWTPVKFRYPEIEPCAQELSEVKPIPYRPFRWGTYNTTMGIRNMPWTEWIELDKGHGLYHKIKSYRLKARGERVVRVLTDEVNSGVVKGGSEAAVELVHELAEFLSRRYPKEFQIVRHSLQGYIDGAAESTGAFSNWGWEDQPPVKMVLISSLGVSFELPLSVEDGSRAPERAMEIAGLLIQDDLALMIEGLDGRYYLQAGSISLAGSWRLEDKIGMPLEDIHITGHVPQYKEKLQTSMGRFFRRLPVDKPVARNNYNFQVNRPGERQEQVDREELAWAESTLGPEDGYGDGQKPLSSDIKVEWIRLRTERQTLRRLAHSGAIVFTIRSYLTPITELVEEEGVAGRLASALRSWPADVGEYKGKERGWFGALLEYLDLRVGKMDEM